MTERRPLEGLRVLDFTWAAAGPIVTSFMALLGADVVKVEFRGRPDLMRIANKQYGFDVDSGLDDSPSFREIGAGKRSIELDLRDPSDAAVARRLALVADVVVENMRPGKIEALGLGYGALVSDNPGLVMCSQSGTGRTDGPGVPGYAPIFWAEGGGAMLTGWPERLPGVVRGPVDLHAAAWACVGVLIALHDRRTTGRGRYIDCSAIEVVSSSFAVELLGEVLGVADGAARHGNRAHGQLVNDVFPCHGSDRWLALSLADEDQVGRAAEVVGFDASVVLAGAGAASLTPTAYDEVARCTRRQSASRLEARLTAAGLAASVSISVAAAFEEPRMADRGVWQDGGAGQLTVGLPWTFDGHPYDLPRPAPRLGEHSDAVLREWLGDVVREGSDA